ncbi:hypothetical protein BWI97_26800 [Siphonobacter sp. BAB-5405]|nr:hypothetical protein BWI97_26800 [Siphonobacter sp. BAB-5405]
MLRLARHRIVFSTQFVCLFLFWYLVKYYLSKDTLYLQASTFLVALAFALMGLVSYQLVIKPLFSSQPERNFPGRILGFGVSVLFSQVFIDVVSSIEFDHLFRLR